MSYKFKYKRCFFWHSISVIGHNLEGKTMVLYLPNGGIKTVPEWHLCSLELGLDWVAFTKSKMERESGQQINISPK